VTVVEEKAQEGVVTVTEGVDKVWEVEVMV
jgi:hypothetical protein